MSNDPAARHHRPCATAGVALVEVLIALLVLGIGLAGALRLQTGLGRAADLARQRAVAWQVMLDELESARAGSGRPALAALVDLDRSPAGANAVYRLGRSIAVADGQPLLALHQQVEWTDREGRAQRLGLHSLLADLELGRVGLLALDLGGGTVRGGTLGRRHPLLPPEARSLGDGRVAYKPAPGLPWAWVFDEASGRLRERCDSPEAVGNPQLDAAGLQNCRAQGGQLIQGRVRFAPDPATADRDALENPLGPALPLDLRLTLDSAGHPDPGWHCADDAPDTAPPGSATAQTVVRYFCVVLGGGEPPRWSGRLDLVPLGWTIAASGAEAWRVCRYSADHDHNGRIDNAEHPARYAAVDGPLGDQNFLVVPATRGCPVDIGVSVSGGDNWLDDSSVPHQP